MSHDEHKPISLTAHLDRVQAAHRAALDTSTYRSSKPYREAVQTFQKRVGEMHIAIQQLGADWTPAGDKLPDDDTLVLVATNDGEVWPAYRDGDIWRWGDAMPMAAGRVMHWMPLPAAPARSAA